MLPAQGRCLPLGSAHVAVEVAAPVAAEAADPVAAAAPVVAEAVEYYSSPPVASEAADAHGVHR